LEKDPRRRFPTVQAMVHAYNQATSQHNQTLRIAAPTIRLLKVRTQPGRSLRRRMPILPSMPHRTMHLAGSILIAALLFLVLPLSLGFFLSGNGLQTQALTVSGASIVFAEGHKKPHNTTLQVQPTPTTQASASGYSSTQSNAQGSGRVYREISTKGSGRGHGHRHRHGNRHKSVSAAKERRTSTP